MEENNLRWKELFKFIKCYLLLEVSPGSCTVASEYLQRWKFHNLSKSLQILDYCHSEEVFRMFCLLPLILSLCTFQKCLAPSSFSCIFTVPSH